MKQEIKWTTNQSEKINAWFYRLDKVAYDSEGTSLTGNRINWFERFFLPELFENEKMLLYPSKTHGGKRLLPYMAENNRFAEILVVLEHLRHTRKSFSDETFLKMLQVSEKSPNTKNYFEMNFTPTWIEWAVLTPNFFQKRMSQAIALNLTAKAFEYNLCGGKFGNVDSLNFKANQEEIHLTFHADQIGFMQWKKYLTDQDINQADLISPRGTTKENRRSFFASAYYAGRYDEAEKALHVLSERLDKDSDYDIVRFLGLSKKKIFMLLDSRFAAPKKLQTKLLQVLPCDFVRFDLYNQYTYLDKIDPAHIPRNISPPKQQNACAQVPQKISTAPKNNQQRREI